MMLKRTLVFASPVKLSLKNLQLIVESKADEDSPIDRHTIPIEDIGVVVVENQRVAMTIPVLNALVDHEVQVVFCDSHAMPHAMLLGVDTNNTQGMTLRHQIAAGEVLKKQLWKQIVEAKIRNQARLLKKLGLDDSILRPHYSNVKSGDADNREGIAARLYFQALFGPTFIRDRSEHGINALLNYGYTILRAGVARAIVASGLFPAIGIFHHHRSNAFPLADDVMEPYRPFVDEIVYDLAMRGCHILTKDTKAELINVLYADVLMGDMMRPLSVALSQTTASLVRCYAKADRTLTLPILS